QSLLLPRQFNILLAEFCALQVSGNTSKILTYFPKGIAGRTVNLTILQSYFRSRNLEGSLLLSLSALHFESRDLYLRMSAQRELNRLLFSKSERILTLHRHKHQRKHAGCHQCSRAKLHPLQRIRLQSTVQHRKDDQRQQGC